MITYIEPMTPLRDWLRASTLAASVYVVGQGGLPADAFVGDDTAGDLTGRVIGITRVGGGTDLPFDRPLVQFDCWTPKAGAATAAGRLAADLCGLLESVAGYPVDLGSGLTLHAAYILSNLPLASSHPRHVVTADVTTQAR